MTVVSGKPESFVLCRPAGAGRDGWEIRSPGGNVVTVNGTFCRGLTRWECVNACGLLGIPLTEVRERA